MRKKLKRQIKPSIPTAQEQKDAEAGLIKTIVLTNLLVENLDEIEKGGFKILGLKSAAKALLKKSEKFIDAVWKQGNKVDKETNQTNFDTNSELIRNISEGLDSVYNVVINPDENN